MRREPLPIPLIPVQPDPPHRVLCTDCGVSRMSQPQRCATACQFIRPDHAGLKARVHSRARDTARSD